MAQDTGGVKDAGPWIDPLKYVESKPDLPKETLERAKQVGPLTYTVLIDEKHAERQTLEYKRELEKPTSAGKKEFLADASSFAICSTGLRPKQVCPRSSRR